MKTQINLKYIKSYYH